MQFLRILEVSTTMVYEHSPLTLITRNLNWGHCMAPIAIHDVDKLDKATEGNVPV